MSKFDLGAIVAAGVGFVVPILVWARDAIGRGLAAVGESFLALWKATAVYLAAGVIALGAFWSGHMLGARRAALDRPALGLLALPSGVSQDAYQSALSRARDAAEVAKDLKLKLEASEAEVARMKVAEAKLERQVVESKRRAAAASDAAQRAIAEARQRRPVPKAAPASTDPTKAAWWPFKG